MKENKMTPEYVRTDTWRIALSSMIQSSNTMFLGLMTFASYLASKGYGIATIAAGVIISNMRVFDAITDPIVAWFVPRVRTRFGVARPTVFLGYLLQAVSVFLMFFVGPSTGSQIFFITCYLVQVLGYTFVNKGNEMLQLQMTTDPKQRPLIFRFGQTVTMLTSLALSLLRSNILFPKYGGLELGLFQDLATFILIMNTIYTLVGLFAVAPVDNVENFERNFHGATKFHLKDIWNLIAHNRAFLPFVISMATDKLASAASSHSAITTLLFGVIIGNYAFSGTISIYTTAFTLIMIWMATGTARKKGNRASYLRWCWIAIITAAAALVFMLLVDRTSISQSFIPTVIFVAFYAAMGSFRSTTNANVQAMQLDITDYEFYLHGKFLGPMVASTATILQKTIDSLSSVIIAALLAGLGYVETMPDPSDPYTSSVFWVTMFAWLGLPALGFLASIIAMRFSPLTAEVMVEVQAANNERKAKNAAAYEKEMAKK